MVLGPHDFSIGARNCVVDQTLCTNKTDDDDGVNAAADVLCHVCKSVSTHIYKPFQGKELTLQFTCADMHTVLSVLRQQLLFFWQMLNLFFHNSSATECYNQEMAYNRMRLILKILSEYKCVLKLLIELLVTVSCKINSSNCFMLYSKDNYWAMNEKLKTTSSTLNQMHIVQQLLTIRNTIQLCINTYWLQHKVLQNRVGLVYRPWQRPGSKEGCVIWWKVLETTVFETLRNALTQKRKVLQFS